MGPRHPGTRLRPGHPGRCGTRCPGPFPGQSVCAQLAGSRIRRRRDPAPPASGSSVVATCPPVDADIRSRSFVWPAAEVVLGLVVFGFLVLMGRRRSGAARRGAACSVIPSRMAGHVLLVSSTALLVALGAPWWPSNTSYLAPTQTEVALQKAVGISIVGFGASSCWYPPDSRDPAQCQHRLRGPRARRLRPADPAGALHVVEGLDRSYPQAGRVYAYPFLSRCSAPS